jgi:asparagine synthase (glutamine-hydrolysing)
MVDPATEVRIVFNGEIYNYRALRRELIEAGETFVSEGDTEVILRGYIRHGQAFFSRLRGMYAFVIDDPRSGEMVALRDPFGMKPLYVAATDSSIIFSSSALACARAMPPSRPDPAAAVSLAVFGCVLEPLSKWRGVAALPRGVAQTWRSEGGRLAVREVEIKPAFPWGQQDVSRLDALEAAVRDTVLAHFTADVPVAIFQSAGLDSTLFSTVARSLGLAPTLLTIGFEEFRGTPMDEVPGAVSTAARLGFQHRIRYITRRAFEALQDDIFEAMDAPTADGMNNALISSFARQEGFKVALSGIGADELFMGYPSFHQLPRLAKLAPLARNPLARTVMDGILQSLARFDPRRSPKTRYLARYIVPFPRSYLLRRSYFAPEELGCVLRPEIVSEGLSGFWAAFEAQCCAASGADETTVRALERDVYMRNVLLKDADWTGMAFGVEIRTPFVDVSFHRAVCDGNDRCGYTKADLRNLIARLDPAFDARPRAKSGFLIPHHAWTSDKGHAENLLKFGSAGPRNWNRRVLARHFGDWVLPVAA